MRHNRLTHRFARSYGERQAMFENMVISLLTHQQITTTVQKAKEAKKLADRVISLGKRDDLPSRRRVFSFLQNHELTSKVFKEISPRFSKRNGGYTRILRLGRRKGDGAELALLELTEKEIRVKTSVKKKKVAEVTDTHDHKHEGHDHDVKGHESKKKDIVKQPEASKGQPKQTGFLKNIGKLFRKQGGNS